LHRLVLGADDRFGAGQRGERLVAVARQQQARKVGAEAAPLLEPGEQRVELGVVPTAGRVRAGKALGYRDRLSSETRRLPLPPRRAA
jgi:hypothetical protein